jgi:hypothetical protein
MPSRRDVMAFGAGALVLGSAGRSLAQPVQGQSRLVTRLFNFNPDVPADAAAEAIVRVKASARMSGAAAFLAGRNFIPDPFPARVEWLCMIQFNTADRADADQAYERFKQVPDALAPLLRDQVECDLSCPLAPAYADAAGVGVRHTVMFNFKPDASAQARARNVDAIRAMGKLPMVLSYLVQPSVGSASDPNQMQWQVIGDFASVADYKAYSAAPVHLAIREDFTAHTSRVAFLDVQV